MNEQVIFNERKPNDGSYLIIDRIWMNGDVLSFTLPLSLKTQTWPANRNAVSIYYGPVAYSLDISEQYNRIGGTDDYQNMKL